MGLTATDIDLLLDLRRRRKSVGSIATIGRLSLYLHTTQVSRLRSMFPESSALQEYRWGCDADLILRDITGAGSVSSIDISDYQGSLIVHDMNVPLWDHHPNLGGQFDLVIDGGTLEHVFNFPLAVQNLMFLVRPGGSILTANPANNLCGHGFYQFTPELMYRLYSPVNGFQINHVLLTQSRHMSVEMDPRPQSFRVVDPAKLGGRVLFRNRWPVMIRVLSERIGDDFVASLKVQQSDYVVAWAGSDNSFAQPVIKKRLRKFFDLLPKSTQSRVVDIVNQNSLGNTRLMQKWIGTIE